MSAAFPVGTLTLQMEDRSLSAWTARGLQAMLCTALDQAVKERLIPYNPAIGCRLPPEEEKEMDILPAEQIGACLSEAEERGVDGQQG